MQVVHVRHVCGHRHEHILSGKRGGPAQLAIASMLRCLPCPNCLDRCDPVEMGRRVIDEARREMFARSDGPDVQFVGPKRGYPPKKNHAAG